MKVLGHILSNLVMFILGLELGGFDMWYLTMKTLNETSYRKTEKKYRSYYDKY